MKPYQSILIHECGEPLVPIPLELFAVEQPHTYVKLKAPYGTRSPYYLRQSVLECLIAAQNQLQQHQPAWKIQIFDAYRPIAVQQFMVDYTFSEIVQAQGLSPESLTTDQRQALLEQVYEFWAVPSFDPATPPPHSTGAAVDVTLVDERGNPVDMGSPIDELSPHSYPSHFAMSQVPVEQQFQQNRQLLCNVMVAAGFQQHVNEWWHFSRGDQMWAWLMNQTKPSETLFARYGSV